MCWSGSPKAQEGMAADTGNNKKAQLGTGASYHCFLASIPNFSCRLTGPGRLLEERYHSLRMTLRNGITSGNGMMRKRSIKNTAEKIHHLA